MEDGFPGVAITPGKMRSHDCRFEFANVAHAMKGSGARTSLVLTMPLIDQTRSGSGFIPYVISR